MPVLFVLALLLAPATAAAAPEARASELLSAPVSDPRGERIGTLGQLVIDVDNDLVRYALIERDERDFAYPFTALRRAPGGGFVVDEGRTIAAAPGAASRHGRLAGAAALIGREVRFAGGDRAGEVRDLVVDLGSGEVQRVLVAYEPAMGDPLVSIPLARMRIPADDRPIVLERDVEPREASGLSVRPSPARRRLQSPYTR
jgi:sporulation protein YlmC with PRC-barrel domain